MDKVTTTTSTPKPKAHFKIIFSPGGEVSRVLKGVKAPRTQGVTRANDLQLAINSITNQDNTDNTENNKQMLNLAKQEGQKMEKIVFLPKYVEKKVTVVNSPRKEVLNRSINLKSAPSQTLNVKKFTPGKSSEPLVKKRKLGDLALQTWNAAKNHTPDEEVTETMRPESPSALCFVCGSLIEEEACVLSDNTGTLTETGNRLKAIVSTDINDSQLYPPSCCQPCSLKVKFCYGLMIELKSSVEAMKSTYVGLKEGDLVNTHTHIYNCMECEHEVVGVKSFAAHLEAHLKEENLGSTKQQKVEILKEPDAESGLMEEAKAFLDEFSYDDGIPAYQNENAEYVCQGCGRTFQYLFLLQLHRKAPKRNTIVVADASTPTAQKVCFVCKQPSPSAVLSGDICKKCRMVDEIPSPESPASETQMPQSPELQESTPKSPASDKVSKSRVKCKACGKVMLVSSYAAHKLKHGTKRYTCDSCGAGFNFKYALKLHVKKHDKGDPLFTPSRTCNICMLDLPSPAELRTHLKTEHDVDYEAGFSCFSCQHCSKPFDDIFKLRVHLKLYHSLELNVRPRGIRGRRFECHVCKQSFKSEHGARTHMRNEHNLTNSQMESLKHACEECGKVFSVKPNLLNHINSAHLNIKPMACDVCGVRFGKHSSLIFHKLRHTGEKPFQCSICLKSYRQRNDVMRHLARHVRDKEVAYELAYAVNTSSSKLVSKRYVYLKDSTIKGLLDVAMCSSGPKKRKSKLFNQKILYYPSTSTSGNQEVYEEVILPEGAVLVDQGDGTNVQYIMAEEGQYVLEQPEDSYVIEEDDSQMQIVVSGTEEESYLRSPNGGQYVFQENEDGEKFLVRVKEDEMETIA